jgi:hydroxymethylglutaryl-CoA synthase
MGVEAARASLRSCPVKVENLLFSTSTPAYLDKSNATAIHSALGMGHSGFGADVVGSARSGFAALRAGLFGEAPAVVALSDVRTGRPGGYDETHGGDGAAAFVCGEADRNELVAEYLGGASSTGEFRDRWRLPSDPASTLWEERFGEHAYLSLVDDALTAALKNAGITADDVDRSVVTGLHRRAVRAAIESSGLPRESMVDDMTAAIGNTGTAHVGMLLSGALDRAQPGEVIAVVLLADGVDVAIFRVTPGIAQNRANPTLEAQLAAGSRDVPYATYLTWRGVLDPEGVRRPSPLAPSAPNSWRSETWKYAFVGTRCRACSSRQLPPQRVCGQCGAVDQMDDEPMAEVKARVATHAVDWLAASLNPPSVAVIIDFDGGGRCQCELTDGDPATVAVGDRVEMTFRRLYTTDGVHNYYWKARPAREAK